MKLIAFDLDGTTLIKHKYISERNMQAFRTALKKNILLVPATGRLHSFMPKAVLEIGDIPYFITSNGASVYDCQHNTCIYSNYLDIDTTVRVLKYLSTQNVYFELYIQGEVYIIDEPIENILEKLAVKEKEAFFLQKTFVKVKDFFKLLEEKKIGPEKINLPSIPVKLRNEIWEYLSSFKEIKLTSSFPQNIEINNATANKGNALKFLSEKLNIKPEEIFAVGDNGNDIEMLKHAGISVAMGNASQEVKKIAAYITDSCEEDGVAKAIEKFI